MNTHNARVLEILKSGRSITQLEASRWDDPCLRLSARIYDLRHGVYDGIHYAIEETSEANADGRGMHARYSLRLNNSGSLMPPFKPKGGELQPLFGR